MALDATRKSLSCELCGLGAHAPESPLLVDRQLHILLALANVWKSLEYGRNNRLAAALLVSLAAYSLVVK
jgi:hypothetical protein